MKQNINTIITLIILSLGTTTTLIHGFLIPHTTTTTKNLLLPQTTITTQLYSTLKKRRIEKSEDEWREILTPAQFDVLRNSGTEPPNTSYLNTIEKDKTPGSFQCVGCGSPLFTTSTKFDSGTGWPSFFRPIDANAIDLSTDFKMILPRTECSCQACGGHLGHVFDDGPDPTGQRFCMNGVAMTFSAEGEDLDLTEKVVEREREDPYVVGMGQALPGILTNLVVGGLFVNSVWLRVGGGVESPLDLIPLVPAIYFAVLAAKGFRRILSSSSP